MLPDNVPVSVSVVCHSSSPRKTKTLTRTIELAREQRDDKELALALFNLGVVEHQRGRVQLSVWLRRAAG